MEKQPSAADTTILPFPLAAASLLPSEYSHLSFLQCTLPLCFSPLDLISINPLRCPKIHFIYSTGPSLKAELSFMNDLSIKHPKSDRVWRYRRLLLLPIGDSILEL